jgi:hypothetical protein
LNHERLLSEFSQALATIGDALRQAKLSAELFQTNAIRDAIAQLYGHILVFLQQAMHWYNRSPAGRAISAIFDPYELRYQDTAEAIKRCAQAVDDMASAASRTEIRDVNTTVQLMHQKLFDMQAELQKTQKSQLSVERNIDRVLQIANSARPSHPSIRSITDNHM